MPPITMCDTNLDMYACQYNNHSVFTAQGYAKRGICRRRVSVCVSVCLSVTLRYYIQEGLLLQRDLRRYCQYKSC